MAHVIVPPEWRRLYLDGQWIDNLRIHDTQQWQVGMQLDMTLPNPNGKKYTFRCQVMRLLPTEVHLKTVAGVLPTRAVEKMIIPGTR